MVYKIGVVVLFVFIFIVKDEFVFFWLDCGIVMCLEWEMGDIVWCECVGGNYYGLFVWVDGWFYCVD